jgi:tyrosyl-tRNA synthetase
MDLIEEFTWREMLQDVTEGTADALAAGPVSGYIGFDPTASSLHVGNLMPIMGLVHLQRAGHTPIILTGGGTGLIGDPSGKADERALLTKEDAAENSASIRAQLEHFLDFDASSNAAMTMNNLDWLSELSMVDFLRDVGKHFSVNAMMNKESVRRRLEGEDSGITFTEFAYMLLQAYDFVELNGRVGCTLQMGGSDQWGNITAGIDLLRRMRGEKAYGITLPLITGPGGEKFGKTAAGAVWLDPERTSPYRFYQFWINTGDEEVIRYLKFSTLLSRDEIAELEDSLESNPQERAAQRALAEHVTRAVHGESGLHKAAQATSALFGGDISGLGADDIADIFADVPSSKISNSDLEGEGKAVVDLLVEAEIATSKGDARRSIEGGGIYANSRRINEPDARLTSDDAVEGRYLILRKGKKRYHLVEVV